MKILFVNSLYAPNFIGGAERSVQILAESVASAGHEAVVATTGARDTNCFINHVKVHYIRVPNLYWMYTSKQQATCLKPFWHFIDANNQFAERKIHDLICSEQPDIIHTNNLAGFSVRVWRVAKKCGIPIVHTLRDCYLLCPRSTMFKHGRMCSSQCFSCKILSIPKKVASSEVDAVAGISHYILNKHLSAGYFRNARIKTYIFNPIERVQSLEHHEDGKIRLGYVGILAPEKGIEFLIERLDGCMPNNAVVRIFGRGVTRKYETHLRGRYESSTIQFWGHRDPCDIFRNIDVLIVPSLWPEPFGRVVPEAYAFGIPVLASNRGALPEIVEEGRSGYIFNPDIPEDFEIKLRKMIRDRDILKTFKLETFDADRIRDQYMNLYGHLIKA